MARILIIDDEDAFRGAARKLLERAGHHVTEARSGSEGFRLFKEEPTDLVMTDIIMPDKDGIETIQLFRNEWPGVKVLAVSGGGMIDPEERLNDAGLLGADRTLLKSLVHTHLVPTVAELLSS